MIVQDNSSVVSVGPVFLADGNEANSSATTIPCGCPKGVRPSDGYNPFQFPDCWSRRTVEARPRGHFAKGLETTLDTWV